jgi:putative membrane protein
VLSFWTFVSAAGLLWGGYWMATSFGFDVANVIDWRALGAVKASLLGFLVLLVIGSAGMAVGFITENWNFHLARVPGERNTILRTTQGLFRTREVNRDDDRLRGAEIREPVLWRWMGMADTSVIATGLSMWSLRPAASILPRGPVRTAREVATAVLGAGPGLFTDPLSHHPRAALHRRIRWAITTSLILTAFGHWLPFSWAWLAGAATIPFTIWAAVISYRSLGHRFSSGYLVVRAGLIGRSTAALQPKAIIGWHGKQSLPQRWLGLSTLTAVTAAGHGQYSVIDLDAGSAAALAEQVTPGLLTPFLHP